MGAQRIITKLLTHLNTEMNSENLKLYTLAAFSKSINPQTPSNVDQEQKKKNRKKNRIFSV